MKVVKAPFMRRFIRMACDSWDQGWHECNGGNLSYRIRHDEMEPLFDKLTLGLWLPCCVHVPMLAGEFFVITAAGSYFRNMADDPERCLGIIQLNETGTAYRQCWGFAHGGSPTSELPTHLLNHQVRAIASGGIDRVLHHAHPTDINALTFALPLDSETFTRRLWSTISECAMVFPDGVGVLGWDVPGSVELAVATADLMERTRSVVWAHHGIICAGATFDETFGLMHTIEKAASVLVRVLAMGDPRPDQRITDEDVARLAQYYGLQLSIP